MPPDGDAVVGGEKDVGLVEFSHFLEFGKYAADLPVDVFDARVLPPHFVTDRRFVPPAHHARDLDFVAQVRVTVVEGMPRQVIVRQGR